MSHLPPLPGWSQLAARQAHLTGNHAGCRASQCLIARASQQADQLSTTLDQLQQTRQTLAGFPPAPVPCGVCVGLLEHITEISGQPYWRHLGSISGPPHAGAPELLTDGGRAAYERELRRLRDGGELS